MKLLLIIFTGFFLASCATTPSSLRLPAQTEIPNTCNELTKSLFLSKDYEKNLKKVLLERKLISMKEKFITVQHPRLEWINKVKKSLNQSLRNWNSNRYPAFYLFSEEEVVPMAKRYAENVEKIETNQVTVDDEETTKAYVAVTEWISAYKNYRKDMDELLEERISLQYNLQLLKKLKQDSEARDIQLTIKRAGKVKSEIITLHKEDKNLGFTITKLKKEMNELDGTLIKNGKIKDRIMRQAMLQDMLMILEREMEYATKNGLQSEALTKELGELTALVKKNEFSPVTFGVYKIQDKVFISEVLVALKLDVFYNKIKDPVNSLKQIVADYFKNRNTGTDQKKIGLLKRFYAKVSSITPKQAAVGGGTIVIAGLGAERYFTVKPESTVEMLDKTKAEEIGPEDQAHQQQLENTKKVELEKQDGLSGAIEVHLDELTGAISVKAVQ